MATKQEFLNELDEHSKELRTASEQLSASIKSNTDRLAVLESSRKQRLHAIAVEQLPDLSPVSIARASLAFPNAVSQAQVAQLQQTACAAFKRQLAELRGRFYPAKAANRLLTLESSIASTRDDLKTVQAPLDDLLAIPGLTRLIDAGYGTRRYLPSFWNAQWWTDWRTADEAVAQANVKDWSSLAQQYAQWQENVQSMTDSLRDHENEIAKIRRDERDLAELQAALDRVPAQVLEQLQLKIEAELSTTGTQVASIDTEIVEIQAQNRRLQEPQANLSKEIANLRKIRTRAAESRKRNVPDQYVNSVRTNRAAFSDAARYPSGSASSTVVVHDTGYYGNSSFYNGMLFNEMFHHFDDRGGRDTANDAGRHEHGSQSSYRDESYAAARNDHSGNS